MAAHLEGRQVTVLNQTGLAQKNGPVSSHVRIRPGRGAYGRRVGRADVLLAADLLTTSDPRIMALLSTERTRSIVDVAVASTAGLATDPDLDLSAQPLVEAVRARSAETVGLPFRHIATRLLGPAAEGNVLLLGYALQRGLLAADPAGVTGLLDGTGEDGEQESTDAFVADRAVILERYQNREYAGRYRALVDAAIGHDRKINGTGEFSRAVAAYFFKVMAYKDEYEVARLYTDGEFADQLKSEFAGFRRISLNLAPQRFFPRDPRTGRPYKIAIPGRLGLAGLRGLAAGPR
jgi:indolepyruvate ferredoxin oxidoreductase